VQQVRRSIPIAHIIPHLCGMPSRVRKKRLVTALRAFFDESGLNPNSDSVLVMGGYLGSIEEWERVSDAWDACLRSSPKIEYFKSSEASTLHGQFKRFNRNDANAKSEELAKIIGNSELQGFCASVIHAWLESRDPKLAKGMVGSRTYDWGFFTATSGVLQYIEYFHPLETVDFIFDKRPELRGCIAFYEQVKELAISPQADLMRFAGSCTPGDDVETVALQVADLVAGEFSSMANQGKEPSLVWKLLTAHRSVIHLPCQLPPNVPLLVEMHSLAKDIGGVSGTFLKRFYKEEERSFSLLNDLDEIAKRKVAFDMMMKVLREYYESSPEFLNVRDKLRKNIEGVS
jgi:Protein of unknown function (DUF3800)